MNGDVNNITTAFVDSYQPDDFLSTRAQKELESFVNADIGGVNITGTSNYSVL